MSNPSYIIYDAEMDLKRSIIEFMRDRPFLWNNKLAEYKDYRRREDAFLAFSEEIDCPVTEIKRIWHVLRTNFFRAHKILLERKAAERNAPAGAGANGGGANGRQRGGIGSGNHYDGSSEKLWKYYTAMEYVLASSNLDSISGSNGGNNNGSVNNSTTSSNAPTNDDGDISALNFSSSSRGSNVSSSGAQAAPATVAATADAEEEISVDKDTRLTRSSKALKDARGVKKEVNPAHTQTSLGYSGNMSINNNNNGTTNATTANTTTNTTTITNTMTTNPSSVTTVASTAANSSSASGNNNTNSSGTTNTTSSRTSGRIARGKQGIDKTANMSALVNSSTSSGGGSGGSGSLLSSHMGAGAGRASASSSSMCAFNDLSSLVPMELDDDHLYARSLTLTLKRFDPTTKEVIKLKFQEIIVEYMQKQQWEQQQLKLARDQKPLKDQKHLWKQQIYSRLAHNDHEQHLKGSAGGGGGGSGGAATNCISPNGGEAGANDRPPSG